MASQIRPPVPHFSLTKFYHKILHSKCLPFSSFDALFYCFTCLLAKCRQLPFLNNHSVVTQPLQLVCADSWVLFLICLSLVSNIIFHLLINLLIIHGFIQLSSNLMFTLYFPNFYLMLKDYLTQNCKYSKVMVAVNLPHLLNFANNLVLPIASLAHILINKTF